MRKRFNAIYKVTNPIEGKHYIGQTTFTISSRKASHKRKALVLNKQSPFYDAIRKFGFDIFEWEILLYCDTPEELDEKERDVISSIGADNCYNSNTGGKSKFKVSKQTRDIISSQKMGENNPHYGKRLTEEAKTKLLSASMEVCSKGVGKLGENGEIVEKYPSISECARSNGASIGSISLHVNGKIKTQKYVLL